MAIHVVAEGDTLSAIAEAHGSTLAEIISLNPQIPNPDLIHPGQEVNVPDEAVAEPEPLSETTAAVTADEAPAADAAPVAASAPVLEGRLAE